MIVLTRAKLFLMLLGVVGATALATTYAPHILSRLRGPEAGVDHSARQMAAVPPAAAEREVLYWYDPMHPAYKSDQPGIAPDCGMQLVPRYADEVEAMSDMAPGTVRLSPEKQQLIGVRTAQIGFEDVARTLRAVGIVEMDETRISHVHTKVSGWVRQVFVDYTWQHVQKNQPLFTLYSPELVSAQQEYLLALRAQSSLGQAPYQEVVASANALLRAARQRLKLWDVTGEQIAQLEAEGKAKEELTVFSPVMGHVSERKVFPNQYVTPESDLYTIVDHSYVWVQAQLYEYEIAAVHVGQRVAMTVTALPGRVFRGQVIYVDPHLDTTTRSVNVRLEFSNPDLALKPGMYATTEFRVALGRQLVVPREAVIDTGARQLVFLARGNGYFEPREIQVGPEMDERVVVLDGLEPGETIVTSGAFLIDSESQLSTVTGGMTQHEH